MGTDLLSAIEQRVPLERRFIIDTLAVGLAAYAFLPYWAQYAGTSTSGSLTDYVILAFTQLFGIFPWLASNPLHLVLAIPGFLVFLRFLRPPY